MKLIETTVSETSVRMRYADDADPAKATSWVAMEFPLSALVDPHAQQQPFGDPPLQFLGEVQLAALRYARELVNAESQRLSNALGRMR